MVRPGKGKPNDQKPRGSTVSGKQQKLGATTVFGTGSMRWAFR